MKKLFLIAALIFALPLAAEVKVLAFSGSTRADSMNGKLVNEAADLAREMGANVTVINLKDYSAPFYDADLETSKGMPKEAKKLRDLILQSNALIIASPEYNGSISAALKNALDWASRSESAEPSREAFQGKKVLIMSVSPGPLGGSRGLNHLRTIVQNIGGNVLTTEISVPNGTNVFNSQGKIQDRALKEQIKKGVKELLGS